MNRKELIAICEKAIVPQEQWSNRDSAQSQIMVGKVWALLKAGCDFKIRVEKADWSDVCITDERTIWLDITYNGFGYFEGRDQMKELCYLPTLERLERGGDWY